MLLAEHLGDRVADFAIKIYGTDIDEDTLATARQALYRRDQLTDVPDAFLDRYFTCDGLRYRLRRELRRWCVFGSHNVAMAPPLSRIDLLVCRNVLIYVNSELQERILARPPPASAPSVPWRPCRWRSWSSTCRTRSQSTNEELETTVEELQAANGELAALNTELESRAAELTRLDVYQRGVVDALEQGVIVLDPAGVVRAWNRAAERIWGLRAGQVLGRELFVLPVGEVARLVRRAFARVLEGAPLEQLPGVPYTSADGHERRAVLRVVPVRSEGGEVLGVVGVMSPTDESSAEGEAAPPARRSL